MRAGADRDAADLAACGSELAEVADLLVAVPGLADDRHASGVAGREHVARHVAGPDLQVHLHPVRMDRRMLVVHPFPSLRKCAPFAGARSIGIARIKSTAAEELAPAAFCALSERKKAALAVTAWL